MVLMEADAAQTARPGHARRHDDAAAADAADDAADPCGHAPDHVGYDAYRAGGGYHLLQACAAGRLHPESVIVTMMASGLQGPDPDGIAAGRRWRQVRADAGNPVLRLRVDAAGPGAFTDRFFLERDPHRVLEGALLAAWTTGVDTVHMHLREDHDSLRILLEAELERLRADVAAPGFARLVIDDGAAVDEAFEHDAETLYRVRDILERGAEWFRGQGRHGRRGLRAFSVSGPVRAPGVKHVPAGTTVRELIDEHSGGMRDGRALYAYLPGGAAGAILPAAMDDIPLDADVLRRQGVTAHPGAVVVLADGDRATDAAHDVLAFLHAAPGRCPACGDGVAEARVLLARGGGAERLAALAARLRQGGGCCARGRAAAQALDSVLIHFPHELDRAHHHGNSAQ